MLSNNSRYLHIQVDEFQDNRKLTGTRISVIHEQFGVLFCTVMNASGDLITDTGQLKHEDWLVYNLSTSALWSQLEKFGFFVDYKPGPDISKGQLEYLLELKKLGYDKLRYISIWHRDKLNQKIFDSRIVAFRPDKLSDWLNLSFAPSEKVYFEALEQGWCFNVSTQVRSKKYDWTWLENNIISIDDLAYDAATDPMLKHIFDDDKLKLSPPKLLKYNPDPYVPLTFKDEEHP